MSSSHSARTIAQERVGKGGLVLILELGLGACSGILYVHATRWVHPRGHDSRLPKTGNYGNDVGPRDGRNELRVS